MIYLSEKNLNGLGVDWTETVDVIEKAVMALSEKDFAQPVKPYLRYRDLTNRIIAMPAFIGGEFNSAGIKWIASFPGNIENNIPRAHSVVILNKAETGEPYGIINTAMLSILRTASVSGLMLKYFDNLRNLENVKVGMTGFGPIGQYHMKMCFDILKDKIDKFYIYDLREVDESLIDPAIRDKVVIAESWQEAYDDADVFMTCTVSKAPYIDKKPKEGSLQLNVSLRDYKTSIFDYVKDAIIVDDWEEICREKTDVEMLHLEKGLQEEQTKSIVDMVAGGCMEDYPKDAIIMFNPMGMAVFDIALGVYYLGKAQKEGVGTVLE